MLVIGRRVFARRELWLLAHRGMREKPRVRLVFDHLIAGFRR